MPALRTGDRELGPMLVATGGTDVRYQLTELLAVVEVGRVGFRLPLRVDPRVANLIRQDICTHVRMCACVYACMHVSMWGCVCACTHVRKWVCM